MQRRKKSLHHNLQEGENVVFHHEHRSKRGRNKMFRADNEIYHRFQKEKEELKYGVDKKSLRFLRNRYKVY